MTPTDEQVLAADLFSTGRDLVINAGAGCGKTTTLKLLGESTDRPGRFLAFNRSIVNAAKAKMPPNVQASTLHSAAFRACGVPMKHRLDSARMPGWKTAERLGISPLKINVGHQSKLLQPGWLAGHVMRAVTSFCHSADPQPGLWHFNYVEGIDLPTGDGRRTYDNNRDLAAALLPALVKAWGDLCDPAGELRYSHDCYLKHFAIDGHQLGAKFILHDEAQDANPVTLQILDNQENTQLVSVGDQFQSIYTWRGAVDGLELARESGAEGAWLTQSFRFGPAIADLANRVLRLVDADMQLVGLDSLASSVGVVRDPEAVLCRTNAEAVRQVMLAQRLGQHPHLVGGGTEIVSFAKAALQLKAGEQTGHPELACFTSWGEVQDFVKQDALGDELRLLVDLIDEFDPDTVVDALELMPDERRADVVVSTAHKAKGREWLTVKLGPDFAGRPDEDEIAPEEVRLLYMAVTRAQQRTDATVCVDRLAPYGINVEDGL